MADKKQSQKLELFFPYYVNQGRLIDIFAILNGGYSEYYEITTSISQEKNKGAEASANCGFKLFNLGGSVSGEIEKTDSQANENKEKKVQTVTSMLSIVKNELAYRGYMVDILGSKPGEFVCLPVVISINSIKSLMNEISELLKLTEEMKKLGANIANTSKNNKDLQNIIKTIRVLFGGEEILFESDKFAIVGNITDSNLYQSVRSDIIGTELKCLAQVKRVFPDGTELMKNTIFTKINNPSAKKQLIDALNAITKGEIFDFGSVAIPFIYDKPVYQLEIIALYQ